MTEPSRPAISDSDAGRWWFATVKGRETQGPLDRAAVETMAKRGEITGATLLWEKGVSKEWKRADQSPDFSPLFPPPPSSARADPPNVANDSNPELPRPPGPTTAVTVDQTFASYGDFEARFATPDGVKTCRWVASSLPRGCIAKDVPTGTLQFSLKRDGEDVISQNVRFTGPIDSVVVQMKASAVAFAGRWFLGSGLVTAGIGSGISLGCVAGISNFCAAQTGGWITAGVGVALLAVGLIMVLAAAGSNAPYEVVVQGEGTP